MRGDAAQHRQSQRTWSESAGFDDMGMPRWSDFAAARRRALEWMSRASAPRPDRPGAGGIRIDAAPEAPSERP